MKTRTWQFTLSLALVLGALLLVGCAKKSEATASEMRAGAPSAGGEMKAMMSKASAPTAPSAGPVAGGIASSSRASAAKTADAAAAPSEGAPPTADVATAQQIASEAKAPEVKESAGSESEPEKLEGKLIRNATVVVQVVDVGDATKRVREVVSEYGGYVGDSDIQHAEGSATRAILTVRLPSKRYEDFIDLLQSSDFGKLIQATETTEDVTEEWIDIDARMRTLTEQREELRKQLSRAPDLSTYAQLQREIQQVQQQIEQAKGRLQYLNNKVTYSTIKLELKLKDDVSTLIRQEREAESWSAQGTVGKAWAACRRILQFAASVAIWFAFLIPCWGPVGVFLWITIRRQRKARTGA